MTSKEKSILQKEIVDSLEPKPHGRALLAPRVGKTKLVIDTIKRDKPASILWVTPSAELAEKDIPEEFVTWKAKRFIKNLSTVTWMSLNKIVGHYEMVVLDEEQFATENNLETLLDGSLSADYIFSMTGTPTKHKEKEELYKRLNLEVLYELSINEAVDIGLLSNYDMKILEVDMNNKKSIVAGTKEKPFMVSEMTQYAFLDKSMKMALYQKRRDVQYRIMARRRFIANSTSKFEAAKFLMTTLEGRKMFFAGSIDQAEKLCENVYHSKTDNKDLIAFKNGDIDNIALVDTGGTGHTYKEIDHLIVIQSDSDKNGRTSQKISRTLLQQKDYKATVWLISLTQTQDEKWVKSTLENFDMSKVEYIRFKNLMNNVELPESVDLDMFKKHGVKTIQKGKTSYEL